MTSATAPSSGSEKKESVMTKFVHPFIVVRDAIRKKFVLRKKPKPGEKDRRVVRRAPKPKPEGSVLLTTSEKKYRLCKGSQNLWYECEDRLCNKYWLNDATGEKTTRKPKAVTIIQLMNPKDDHVFEKRVLYLRTRPNPDYSTEVRQLLILSENESIQRIRAEATNIGARQLEHAEIHDLDDLLRVVGIPEWKERFDAEGIDLATAFFLRDDNLAELGLGLGERIRLSQVLECMRKIEVVKRGGQAAATEVRNTKFIKGDIVEHLKESENLIRRGKVVGVHADDIAAGVYYTVALENEGGYEVQSAERKLEFPGIWEKLLRERGIEPIFKEPGGDEENPTAQAEEASVVVEEEQVIEDAPIEETVDVEYNEQVMANEEYEEMAEENAEEATEEEGEYSGRAALPVPLAETSADVQSEGKDIQVEEDAGDYDVHADHMPMFVGMNRYGRRQSVAPPGAISATEPIDDRKQSVVSLLPMVDTEELIEDEISGMAVPPPAVPASRRRSSAASKGSQNHRESVISLIPTTEAIDIEEESSGMTVPPPAIPASRRRSSAASRGSGGPVHRESVFSLLTTTEAMDLEEPDGETSGMLAPPPPIPHRSDSVWSEQGIEGIEELSTYSVSSVHEDEDSGMPGPPPIPPGRRGSSSSRRDSNARRDSNTRRVSFTNTNQPVRRPSSTNTGDVNDSTSIRMDEELSAMGEMEPMEMHEEMIDIEE